MASVLAISDLHVSRLPVESFRSISASNPTEALSFVEALVDILGERLTNITESVGFLLRERSLPRRLSVMVQVCGDARLTKIGTPVDALLPTSMDGHLVVGGLIDRRAVSLSTPISSECVVDPLTTAHWEGRRLYRRSLALLLLEAAHDLDPALEIHLGHSLGFAQRVRVEGIDVPNEELAEAIENRMRILATCGHPLREEWWTVDEARAHFEENGWHNAAELLSSWRDPAVPLSSYGSVYSVRPGPLLPNTGLLEGFDVLADEDGLLLVYGDGGTAPESDKRESMEVAARVVSKQANKLTREHRRWLAGLGMASVGEFNRACVDGDVSTLIRVAEGFQEKRLSQIADEICHRGQQVKVVCIAGPSSSGKTTFIKRLKVQLQVNGLQPHEVSLDNYYCDREKTPRDRFGEYDYEAMEALRRDLLSGHLKRLLSGEEVTTARYDFGLGVSQPAGGPTLHLEDHDILMLEGIHGLNPELLASVPESVIFRIFVCPLAQLPFDRLARVHASDLRLLRRLVRDRHFRGATPVDSIARWPSVRRGERKHIYPHQNNADAVFDSSLIYEFSVLKVFAERYLLEVPQSAPEYTTAFRLLELCDRFVTIYPDHVPPTSILREFIGGSGFEF
jgi:uridine kinase